MEPTTSRPRRSHFPGIPRPSLPGPSQPGTPVTPLAARASRKSLVGGSNPSSASRVTINQPQLATPPSLSAPIPFDWEAVRNNAPPPYGTPLKKVGKARPIPGAHGGASSPKKRVVRKTSWYEWASAFPSRVMFELSLFPHNIPLPHPKTSGRAIGGLLHFTHMLVKWYGRSHVVPKEDADDIWKSEVEWDLGGDAPARSLGWTSPIAFLLLIISVLNAFYLFTRIRTYHLLLRNELVRSSHASLVSRDILNPPSSTTIPQRILKITAQSFRVAWRLIFGTSPSPEDLIPIDLQPGSNKVQQLDVWFPGDLEMSLFTVYSPAHFLTWRIFSAANWFFSFIAMGVISLQIYALIFAYEALIKDKEILSAEVLHEYDTKFVHPRLHPLKRDASTMTNEAETVVDWRRY